MLLESWGISRNKWKKTWRWTHSRRHTNHPQQPTHLMAMLQSPQMSSIKPHRRLLSVFLFQTKCFICGIGNDYFDTVPHGFETHTLQEHNLANYLWVLFYTTQYFSKHRQEFLGSYSPPLKESNSKWKTDCTRFIFKKCLLEHQMFESLRVLLCLCVYVILVF